MPSSHCFSLGGGANVPCPAPGQVAQATASISLGCMRREGTGLPELTVLSMVLKRKIRNVEKVSYETSANLLDPKGENQLALFGALSMSTVFVGIISRNLGWWESNLFLCSYGSDFC